MRNLAIIPARSGSKGLPDKNIKLLCGKPLMAYSIEAALESGIFGEVYCSTDSIEYAEVAKACGANVPFLRSSENSTDTASSWNLVFEALEKYRSNNVLFDTISLLQPTSPLRTAEDIVNGYRMMEEKDANAVISVCKTEHSPLWCNTLPDDLLLKGFISPKLLGVSRHLLPTYYRINGALYIVKYSALDRLPNLYEDRCYAYVMDQKHSIDIDDELDFMLAETIIKSFSRSLTPETNFNDN